MNGLSYYDYTFLRELPRLLRRCSRTSSRHPTRPGTGAELPSFLRMGSWIGGDRDGNPFVTAEVLAPALQLQSKRALSFYLDELHALGGELSLDERLVGVSDEVRELAERSPDRSTHRAGRTVSARHLRHLRAPRRDGGGTRTRRGASPRGRRRVCPIPTPHELLADLTALHAPLSQNGSAVLARGRLRSLRRAVDVFGFHLAASTCARTRTCTSAPSASSSR